MSGGNASLSGSATKQEHYHAFLSHNGADKPLVEQLKLAAVRMLYDFLGVRQITPSNPARYH